MVSKTVALREQALKGSISLPGKPGNAGGRHDLTLTPSVPMGIRPDKYSVSFEACSALFCIALVIDINWMFKFKA